MVFLLFALPFVSGAESNVSHQRLMNIASEFKGYSGFEVVKLGRIPLSMIRSTAKVAAKAQAETREERQEVERAIAVLDGIKKMAVVSYEDASVQDKSLFDSKVSSALESYSLLASFSEEDETVKMYGVADENGGGVRDFVMYVQGEALVCFFGTISMDSVNELVQESSR